MATQDAPKQQAVFPDLPRTTKLVDENGNMNLDWQLFFDNLTLALQVNFKPEGIVVPNKPSTDIALLTAPVSVANIIYDSTTDEFKGNIAGTWKTFTLT
jgi:hypothetical protein